MCRHFSLMTNDKPLFDRLRSSVRPRDPDPLHSLLASWAESRGQRRRLPFSQERLLESINERPCINRTRRTRSLGWSIRKFQTAQEQLEEAGYLEREQIIRGTGRPDAHLVLTDKAYRYLKRLRIPIHRLHGSLEHHCSICELASAYRAIGFEVQKTATLASGHIVDLLCTNANEKLALEVVHSDNLNRDAKKASAIAVAGYKLVFVTTSQDLFAHYDAKLPTLLPIGIRDSVAVALRDELISAIQDGNGTDPLPRATERD